MKILFVHSFMWPYVKKDFDILSSIHCVKECHFRGLKDVPAILRGVRWCDLSFSWFGKLHAFFAVLFSRMLGKKAVVVAGGDDVACEPQINYGMFSSWWKKWCPLFVFRYADLVLSVSDLTAKEALLNARVKPDKLRLVYHGFDSKLYRRNSQTSKHQLVLTIATVNKEYIARKKLDLFVEAAVLLPEVQFVIVGPCESWALNHLRSFASPNVKFTGKISHSDLITKYLSPAKVYVQISLHEGFGCAVAEAMLCECIPVVSKRGAIPEVAGDCGYYIDKFTPQTVAQKIKMAFGSDLGKKARIRIERLFPLEKRQRELLRALDRLV